MTASTSWLTASPDSAHFNRRFWPWLALSLASATACGWGAAYLQQRFSPLVMFPLLLGLASGACMLAGIQWLHMGHRKSMLLGTLLAGGVAVATFHLASFRIAQHTLRALWTTQHLQMQQVQLLSPESLPPAPPNSLWEFLTDEARRGRQLPAGWKAVGAWAWVLWAAEAALVLAAATLLVSLLGRGIYCNRCQRWYRLVRTGQLQGTTAQELCQRLHLPACSNLHYQIFACPGGCSPTCCQCETMSEKLQPVMNQAWLTPVGRNELYRLLDEH